MHITATEVAMREREYRENELPKYQAAVDAMVDACFGRLIRAIFTYYAEENMQQQRMTDDGCPLAEPS